MSRDIWLIIFTAAIGAVLTGCGYIFVNVLDATKKNTIAVLELSFTVRSIMKELEKLSKIERDVLNLREWKSGYKK